MITIDQKNQEVLITRYLAGEASYDEIVELQAWLVASKDNLLYFQHLKNIWDNTELNISENMINIDKAFNLINKRVTLKSPATSLWYYWKKIAAVLLIPLVLGNLLYFSFRANNHLPKQEPVYNELFAAFGTRSALKLSDGTSVWLKHTCIR